MSGVPKHVGTVAYPQVLDNYTSPSAPESYKSCISYDVSGGIMVTSGERVVYTVMVEVNLDVSGMVDADRMLTRTGELYSDVRYSPAKVSNFECCETNLCNSPLMMVYDAVLSAPALPMINSLMVLMAGVIGFFFINRM
eukprot:gene26802-4396_t